MSSIAAQTTKLIDLQRKQVVDSSLTIALKISKHIATCTDKENCHVWRSLQA